MRILVISHSCVIEVNQCLYVELASHRDVELIVVTPEKWRSVLTAHMFSYEQNTRIKNLILPKPVFYPDSPIYHFYWSFFLDVFRQYKPQLIFVDEEPWSLVAFQAFLLAKVFSVRLVFYTKENILRQWSPLLCWTESLLLRHADHALAIGSTAKDVLLRKNCRAPITIMPHAVDPDLFYRQRDERLKQELRLTGTVIGYIGRLDRDKGLVSLIRAVAEVEKKAPALDFSVLIVGEGPDGKHFKKLVSSLGLKKRFCFTGYVPHSQAPRYINSMDMLALPSLTRPYWKEQFGRVLIEVLACGVPVIGSDSGEIPHVIDKVGGGVVFHEGDVGELAEKLLLLIQSEDLRQALAATGRERVLRSYTYSIIAEQLHTLFRQVLS